MLSHLQDADAVVRACTSCRALRCLLDTTRQAPYAPAARPTQFRGVARLRVRAPHPSFEAAASWLPGSFPDLRRVDCSRAGHVPEGWLAPLLQQLPLLEELDVSGLHAWQGRASLPALAPGARLRRLDAAGTALDLCSNDSAWAARCEPLRHLTRLRLGGVAHGLWRCHGHGQLKCMACQVIPHLGMWAPCAAGQCCSAPDTCSSAYRTSVTVSQTCAQSPRAAPSSPRCLPSLL